VTEIRQRPLIPALIAAAVVGFAAGAATDGEGVPRTPTPGSDQREAHHLADPDVEVRSARRVEQRGFRPSDCRPDEEHFADCATVARISCALGGVPGRVRGGALLGERIEAARERLQRAGCALRVLEVRGHSVERPRTSTGRYRLNVTARDGWVTEVLGEF
jgi:hypothetical protein